MYHTIAAVIHHRLYQDTGAMHRTIIRAPLWEGLPAVLPGGQADRVHQDCLGESCLGRNGDILKILACKQSHGFTIDVN